MLKGLFPFHWSVRTTVIVLSVFLVLIFSVSALLVFSTENEVIWVQTTRIGTDKQLLARAGARSIEAFFQRVETDLRLLSQARILGEFERGTTRQLFQTAVDRYEGTPLVSFVRITGEGETAISVNREGQVVAEGLDVTDRRYYVWATAQTDNEGVFLSMPVIARAGPLEGQKVVVIAVPAFVDGQFDGVVFASLGLHQLVDEYVRSLAVYEGVQTLVLDQDGTIVSSSMFDDGAVVNAKDFVASQDPEKRRLYEGYMHEILSGENSWVEVEVQFSGESQGESQIVGFAPISFGGRMWSLVVSVSHKEALGRFEKYQKLAQAGLAFGGFGVVGIGALYILSLRKAQSVWYERGFARARDAAKRARMAIGIEGNKEGEGS